MRTTTFGLAMAVFLLPLAAAPAHAANEVVVTMTGGVLYDSCGDYSFSYSSALPAGYGPYWNMDLELVGPDGNIAGGSYLYGEAGSGVDTFQICYSPNLAGTYTIRGTGETRNAGSDYIPISVAPSTVMFRLPMTRTSLKAKPLRPVKGQAVRFTITSKDERPAGYFGTSYASVRLQVKRDGRWRSIKSTTTDDLGRVVVAARYQGRRTTVRAVTTDESDRTGSTSRSVRIG